VKLLFDENLSPQLVTLLADVYPDAAHIHDVGLGKAQDIEIWSYAAGTGYTIVSKDWDYQQLSFKFGHPPKVILLRIGNCSVRDSAQLLRERYILVHHFHENDDAALLMLGE
jgi:predicted nuclease of predicted toxin-antitoxin system